MKQRQAGGFVVGLIVGLLIGLGLALGVALYVTKVPIPFIDKVPQRTADQDAAEAERNKTWDPNAPLAGKPQPARPPASGVAAPAAPPPVSAASAPASAAPGSTATRATSDRDPAAILSGAPARPAAAASAATRSTAPGADPFVYYLQVGAYSRAEDAEQQRAKLAMLGHAAKVTEREQSGRTVYRVRLGPFEKREDADAGKERLTSDAFEAALVRVDR